MENKYYTPTIEEFHVGFECERLVNGIWEEYVCSKSTDRDYGRSIVVLPYEPELNVNSKKVRVKHLDREDIESLGWELRTDANADKHIPEYTIERWYFKTYSNDFCTIYDDSAVDEYVFRGIIKNKSELKKLMVQLGILE